jgi:hypothetical protein
MPQPEVFRATGFHAPSLSGGALGVGRRVCRTFFVGTVALYRTREIVQEVKSSC